MSVALKLTDVHKSFGGNHVLTGLSFDVADGEFVGLLGPNGCGKSTVLNAITGYCPIDHGTIEMHAQRIDGLAPHKIAALSVRRTFQLPSMPSRMTVGDVLMSASIERHGLFATLLPSTRTAQVERQTRKRVRHLLDELLLGKVAHLPAGSISGGQKKLLGIACALMAEPRLLLLDEPMAGVHPNLRSELAQVLKRINAAGITVVLIEHDMHFIAQTCARCVVLDRGRTVADCRPSELEEHEGVVEAYLGRPAKSMGATPTAMGAAA